MKTILEYYLKSAIQNKSMILNRKSLVINFKELYSSPIDIIQNMFYNIILFFNIVNKLKVQISTTLSIEKNIINNKINL